MRSLDDLIKGGIVPPQTMLIPVDMNPLQRHDGDYDMVVRFGIRAKVGCEYVLLIPPYQAGIRHDQQKLEIDRRKAYGIETSPTDYQLLFVLRDQRLLPFSNGVVVASGTSYLDGNITKVVRYRSDGLIWVGLFLGHLVVSPSTWFLATVGP